MMTFRSLLAVCCILAFAACCILVLVSCREKTPAIINPAILGKWETSDQTVEIFKDGKFILTDKIKKEGLTGSYEYFDDDTISVKLKGSKRKDFKISISQDKIIVNKVDGEFVAEYKRAKKPLSNKTEKP